MISISEVQEQIRLNFVLSIPMAFPAHRWIPKELVVDHFSESERQIFLLTLIKGTNP